jgi:uncharacterized protein YjbJ (UPF0337 family)
MCSPASVGKTSRLKHGESSGNLSNDGSRPPTFPPHRPRTITGKGRTEVVKGSAKSLVGRVTGSRRLRAVQAPGNIKQAGAKIKDASGQ